MIDSANRSQPIVAESAAKAFVARGVASCRTCVTDCVACCRPYVAVSATKIFVAECAPQTRVAECDAS